MENTETESNALETIARLYNRFIRFAAGGMMITIFVIMVVQVIARYAFNSSLIWAEELCRYILIWMTFLLLGASYQRGEFITLEMLPGVLNLRARRILKLVLAVPTLFFLGLMTWAGWVYAARFGNQTIPALDFIWTSLTGHALNASIRWVYVSVSVGSALLFIHVSIDLILRFSRLLRSAPDQHEINNNTGEVA